ncbi:MAG: FAD-dependent thymidylate synthase [Spirochaetales bacterium]|nr:FAD-dependent thymidylate synthase [Spirochaetales bacterium]
MGHITIPEAEEILDREFRVLDKGFIRLVDYMGGDARIVQSARVSYGEGTKTQRKDKDLISYLLRNDHMSPFEQVIFTFHVKMPLFVARQWVRHRTARINEISGRYSVMEDEFYIPSPEDVQLQSTGNKQGRSDEEITGEVREAVIKKIDDSCSRSYADYNGMIEQNITRELARVVLPLNLYTQMYWQMDLRNLLHFIRLRADHHAQKEIREYAYVLSNIVKIVAPFTWEAFEEHVLHSMKLNGKQIQRLKEELETTHGDLLKELKIL